MGKEAKDYLFGSIIGVGMAIALALVLAGAIQPTKHWCKEHELSKECTNLR